MSRHKHIQPLYLLPSVPRVFYHPNRYLSQYVYVLAFLQGGIYFQGRFFLSRKFWLDLDTAFFEAEEPVLEGFEVLRLENEVESIFGEEDGLIDADVLLFGFEDEGVVVDVDTQLHFEQWSYHKLTFLVIFIFFMDFIKKKNYIEREEGLYRCITFSLFSLLYSVNEFVSSKHSDFSDLSSPLMLHIKSPFLRK